MQIVEWYVELVRLTDSTGAGLNLAVAVGEADGPRAGLAALDPAGPATAAAAYMHNRDGDPLTAARLYAVAARSAPSLPNATTSRDRPQGSTRTAQLSASLGIHRPDRDPRPCTSRLTVRPVRCRVKDPQAQTIGASYGDALMAAIGGGLHRKPTGQGQDGPSSHPGVGTPTRSLLRLLRPVPPNETLVHQLAQVQQEQAVAR
jgi:hypothetical protein